MSSINSVSTQSNHVTRTDSQEIAVPQKNSVKPNPFPLDIWRTIVQIAGPEVTKSLRVVDKHCLAALSLPKKINVSKLIHDRHRRVEPQKLTDYLLRYPQVKFDINMRDLININTTDLLKQRITLPDDAQVSKLTIDESILEREQVIKILAGLRSIDVLSVDLRNISREGLEVVECLLSHIIDKQIKHLEFSNLSREQEFAQLIVDIEERSRLRRNLRALKKLSLNSHSSSLDKVLPLGRFTPFLKSLSLTFCGHGDPQNLDVLWQIVPNLQELKIENLTEDNKIKVPDNLKNYINALNCAEDIYNTRLLIDIFRLGKQLKLLAVKFPTIHSHEFSKTLKESPNGQLKLPNLQELTVMFTLPPIYSIFSDFLENAPILNKLVMRTGKDINLNYHVMIFMEKENLPLKIFDSYPSKADLNDLYFILKACPDLEVLRVPMHDNLEESNKCLNENSRKFLSSSLAKLQEAPSVVIPAIP